MATEPLASSAPADEPIRLSKRVAADFGCSRSEAERYIEGGFVRVDDVMVDMPQFRVGSQTVTLSKEASLKPLAAVTLIYHKPVGAPLAAESNAASALSQAITAANRAADDRAGIKFSQRHLQRLSQPCPLAAEAGGLVVLTQDGRIVRKLTEDARTIEQEIIVEVKNGQAALSARDLKRLNHGLSFMDKPLAPCKVSWQNENRLRFAIKDPAPGQIDDMCLQVGLTVLGIRRIRIGRLSMAQLPVGQWRYLGDHERF